MFVGGSAFYIRNLETGGTTPSCDITAAQARIQRQGKASLWCE